MDVKVKKTFKALPGQRETPVRLLASGSRETKLRGSGRDRTRHQDNEDETGRGKADAIGPSSRTTRKKQADEKGRQNESVKLGH